MKIKSGFILRDVGGKTFVVAVGELSKTFHGMITLNETGKFIWQQLENGISKEEIVEKIITTYEDAPREAVEKDVETFISKLERDGVLE